MNNKQKLTIFLLSTLCITWGIEFWLWQNGGLTHSYALVVLSAVMMIPALCSLLTRLISHEGFSDMWLQLKLKQNWKTILMAWLGTPLLILLGSATFFLLFPAKLDTDLTVMKQMVNTALQSSDQAIGMTQKLLIFGVLSQIGTAVVFAPILNFIPALGEELGWRGYLLPKLCEEFDRKKAVIISGVIWGIWHAPIIAMGYNYGGGYPAYPLPGILAMIVFCVFVGSIFSWLALRMHSAIPAALAHGALNGISNVGLLLTVGEVSPFIGPTPLGIVGGIFIIIAGIYCYWHIEEVGE